MISEKNALSVVKSPYRHVVLLLSIFLLVSSWGKGFKPTQGQTSDTENTSLKIGQIINGMMDYNSDADVFWFHGVEGKTARIEVNTTPESLNSTVTLLRDVFPPPTVPLALVPPCSTDACGDFALDLTSSRGASGLELDPETELFSRGDVFADVGNGLVKKFTLAVMFRESILPFKLVSISIDS